ncbi:MAG: hypothetical protein FWH47_02850 [Methanomassiliicoccaceae archaeon]|nr:hypothetical protein [Methanomassiliicoccaceae archaeon]
METLNRRSADAKEGTETTAELPEIVKLAGQMRETLTGKTVKGIDIRQEKCSNVPAGEFRRRTAGATVEGVSHKGKWIITALDSGEHILMSLGMGADVLFAEVGAGMPEGCQVKVLFTDGTGYTARFWWFGRFLLVPEGGLASEPSTKDIAIDPFDEGFTLGHLASILDGKRTQVKAFLMDQKNVGGIGNMYMHDILFKARLHPTRKASGLSGEDVALLYESIEGVLGASRDLGSSSYESDFFGRKGGFTLDHFAVGYKEGRPCPACGERIVSIKAGGTSTFICPHCQRL